MSSRPFRLATFNVENLFSRPDFWDPQRRADQQIGNVLFEDRHEATRVRRIVEAAHSDEKCQLTALALLATQADIIALQEVDSADALRSFRETYLKKLESPHVARTIKAALARDPGLDGEALRRLREQAIADVNYRHLSVIDGNDRRGIDIGLLSRVGWTSIRSHAATTFGKVEVWPEGISEIREGPPDSPRRLTRDDRVFKRDLIEAEFQIDGRDFTLFCCHLKSMTGGREATRVIRQAEAEAIRTLIERRFESHRGGPAAANWALIGDFNDYMEIDGDRAPRDLMTGRPSPGGIGALLDPGFAVNLVERRPAEDRWTAYHPPDDVYCQLDYILVSPALAEANPQAVPDIIRQGQPWRAARHDGPRFPRIGWDRPKSSDHCPVAVTLCLR
ncbi:endonuclease/exonuclease/phosphatase family protein [Rhabdaerophilum sp. SD176]|uniref:endonuclease/exonuclease/phosphatase family protein n=1 Tax=Rhabdaerophilum sp. SD176 TaxID=2983548 RepID=UPI0024E0009A|nr:endonuclease/exonuclease/phosphatase family protein [Rhabdaerophilum sp. SD176]